jgi:pimeloyl-ACP methyl ester carboxylesterase
MDSRSVAGNDPASVLKPFRSHRIELRGLASHVLTWGDPAAPKLILLHGWMDVAASFQFLVDAFACERYVIAPDLRGYGQSAWQPQGYWYADYVADLEALLDAFAPDGKVDLAGHSLGGNVVLHYAGVRTERARRVISLDGFGIRAEDAGDAPKRIAKWLDALRNPPQFAAYASFDAVADRLQKNNPRLPRDKALFLARHWAETDADGRVRLVSDPRHKLPFPTIYRIEETYAVWRRIAAPTLWIAAAESNIPRWLDDPAAGEAATDGFAGIRRRLAHIPEGRMVTIPEASHMLHHDQPAAVARAMEAFLDG